MCPFFFCWARISLMKNVTQLFHFVFFFLTPFLKLSSAVSFCYSIIHYFGLIMSLGPYRFNVVVVACYIWMLLKSSHIHICTYISLEGLSHNFIYALFNLFRLLSLKMPHNKKQEFMSWALLSRHNNNKSLIYICWYS